MSKIYDDQMLEFLWKELEDIPCNKNADSIVGLSIAENWRQFESGTKVEDVWRFFDENHSQGVAQLLYSSI
jgi:hypothetical protein